MIKFSGWGLSVEPSSVRDSVTLTNHEGVSMEVYGEALRAYVVAVVKAERGAAVQAEADMNKARINDLDYSALATGHL